MNQWIKALVIALVCLLSYSSMASNVPERILNLPIRLDNGHVTSLADYANKQPVYLKFWATWCQPCRQQMPHFQSIQEQYGNKIKVIAINIDLNESEKAIQATRDEFGLTMAMAIDEDKTLANNMQLIGTPYHLLFDKQMNLVHVTHDADDVLDSKIATLALDDPLEILSKQSLVSTEQALKLPLNDGNIHALFFTATWCDWYLKDSRPEYAKRCERGQVVVNKVSDKFPNIRWHGIVSRLWTGEQELKEYQEKYKTPFTSYVDKSNQLFLQYNIEQLPTLILVKDNVIIKRISDYDTNTLTLSLTDL